MHESPNATELDVSTDAATDTPPCKPAGRPRADEVEARLRNLLATAARLFLDKGYSGVSLEMIAREAHVAVRTIYVKFGGKTGLLNAIIKGGRARFFSSMGDMQSDTRALEQILGDFGLRFLELVSSPAAIELQRMVIAEAKTNPELATAFHQAGPAQTMDMLTRFFARPEIAVQFRADVPRPMLPAHLLNCLMGDRMSRLLFAPEQEPTRAELQQKVAQGLQLFFNGTRLA